VRTDSPVGQETFWRRDQLLVAEEVADQLKELGGMPYESVAGIRRYRLPDADGVVGRLRQDAGMQGLVSVNHLFAAQHRPPWYDHSHESYHFANYEQPTPAFAAPPRTTDEPVQTPVTVGLLDTEPGNPWVRRRIETLEIPPPDAASLPPDAVGHGDLVSGVILGQAPGARLLIGPVMDPGGMVEEFQVIRALGQEQIDTCGILVLAFAGYTEDDEPPPALSAALSRTGNERVVVAAAGNGGHSRVRWPAGLPDVVAVGALDSVARTRWPYSDHGSWVDLWAPGVGIVSTYRDRDAAVWSGTSAAAATVGGTLARLVTQGETPSSALARLAHRGDDDPTPQQQLGY
jgi:hypothetical protein